MCKKIETDINKKYKDNVFCLLFDNEQKAVELYNAIKGTNYKPEDIIMNTLQNPIFVGLQNDISFTVEDKFVILIEHQSSINPNMPLRFLLYIAQIYELLIEKDSIYREKLMSIETPEFYVMYNGKDEYPEKVTLQLSDLFKVKDGNNNLELTVTVYNVNKGRNEKILERSRTLDGYAKFIAKAREYTNGGFEPNEAVSRAVKDCIGDNILREFLEKHGGDVVSILSREFNLDDALRVRGEEKAEDRAEKIAEKMLELGTPVDFIINVTGLSIEKLEKMAKKHTKNK